MSNRSDGRESDQLRPVTIEPHFTKHAEGSVLICTGETRVICTASVEDRVPIWLRGKGQGWVTAEYGMLPRSTNSRMTRESSRGKPSGRTQEIQRLIGRALRSVVNLSRLGERTIWVDCDVIQADGGTRTASVTGAYVALVLALARMKANKQISEPPLSDTLAAVSVGLVGIDPRLDLHYDEDSNADVDMNVVMTGRGYFVEIQGTAEKHAFSRKQHEELLDLAEKGIRQLMDKQKEVLQEELGEKLDELMHKLESFTIAPSSRD